MTSDDDNVVDLEARRRPVDSEVLRAFDAMYVAQMQRDFYEMQVIRLRRLSRAMAVVAVTAYALGIFCGYIISQASLCVR